MTMGDCDGVLVCVLVVGWIAGLVGGGSECWCVGWSVVGLGVCGCGGPAGWSVGVLAG